MDIDPMDAASTDDRPNESAAIIILNFNGVHFLEQFLPSVVEHSQGHRIIVADNASTDSSREFLQENYPEIEIFAFSQNYGFAEGYNQALERVDNTYSILLNSDVEVAPNWIEPVLALMKQDQSIGACQPKVLSYHQKNYFEHAGAAGGFIDSLAYPFCRGRIFDVVEKDRGQYDNIIPIFWATGACFFVRTEVYKSLGGLDAAFFAHMEEIDLCWRMHRAGYKLYCQPASVVYHVGGGTMPASNPRKTYLNFRNSTIMLYKNEHSSALLWKLPAKIFLDLIAALHFIVQGKPKDARAVLMAVKNFIGNRRQWKKAGKKFELINKGPIYTQMASVLVFVRYGLRKKYFSHFKFAQRFSNTKLDFDFFGDAAADSSKKLYQDTEESGTQK